MFLYFDPYIECIMSDNCSHDILKPKCVTCLLVSTRCLHEKFYRVSCNTIGHFSKCVLSTFSSEMTKF